MGEWWSYRPSDFLLFSPRVYERLIESHNAGLWPWQIAAAALGLLALALAFRGGGAGRAALGLAGAGLAFSGWSFLWSRYAAINWAAGSFAPAFWMGGALFAATAAAVRRPLATAGRARGFALAVIALSVAYPLVAPAFGPGWKAAEAPGLMPDPTALAALGLAALIRRPLPAVALAIVPLAWALYAAMTLWTLGAPRAGVMTVGLVLFVAAILARLTPARREGEPERRRST